MHLLIRQMMVGMAYLLLVRLNNKLCFMNNKIHLKNFKKKLDRREYR